MRECSPPTTCHMSCVTRHVSHVMCHVSCVTCHMSHVVKLIGRGSVFKGAYPLGYRGVKKRIMYNSAKLLSYHFKQNNICPENCNKGQIQLHRTCALKSKNASVYLQFQVFGDLKSKLAPVLVHFECHNFTSLSPFVSEAPNGSL